MTRFVLLMGLACLLLQPIDARAQVPGDTDPEVRTLTDRASAAFAAGDLEASVASLRELRALAQRLGDINVEAWSVKQIAYYARTLGDYDLMLDAAAEALRLYEIAEPHDEGWLTMALAHEALNAHRDAAEAYDRWYAVQTGNPGGNWRDRAGQMWEKAGDARAALVRYEDAVRMDAARGVLAGELRSRARAAALYARTGAPEKARAHLASVHQQIDASGKPAGPLVLQLIGIAYASLGHSAAAIRYLDQALSALSRNSTGTLDNLRDVALAFSHVGAPARAIVALTEAIAVADQRGVPLQQARLRAFRAAAERDAGRLAEARADLEWALPVFESVRASVTRPQLRAEYFGTLQRHYEVYIDVLMRLQEAPRALEASERARARLLAEVLTSGGVDPRSRAPQALLREEAALRRRLTTLAERKTALPGTKGLAARHQALSEELRVAERRFDEIQAEITAASPETPLLFRPETPDLSTIQRLLGTGTVLLEYALGETRSYLFVVTGDSFTSFELPARDIIEAAARRVHDSVSRRPSSAASGLSVAAARAFADLVLADAGPLVKGRRLAIVTEGALQYVPFNVLPGLGDSEIVHLPSASVLALQRDLWKERQPAPKRALVLADPVFSTDDPRLGRRAAAARSGERATATLPRLHFSRREAQAISTTFSGDTVFVATDFDASKRLVTSPDLASYRIVHIATHGVVDTAQGTTSALILSQVDEKGRPREGRLGLHDIYALHLSADLVVLSACDTALGRDVRGEGLIGLTRGFMHAGARRVVASLWKVDDAATSELMKAFYEALRRGAGPADALKQAQASVRRQSRFSHPYFWAGFQLHGDWQ